MRQPAPGRFVDVGGRALHFNASGQGKPVVVLEAGIAASSISWSLVQERVARFTTVLSYDRAGFGWSLAAATPAGAATKIRVRPHVSAVPTPLPAGAATPIRVHLRASAVIRG